jgi:primase-polymerase (primpol)-like protein
MTPDFSKIPQELKALPQWVLWKSEIRDGKPTKIPYCPQDPKRKAEADNP